MLTFVEKREELRPSFEQFKQRIFPQFFLDEKTKVNLKIIFRQISHAI